VKTYARVEIRRIAVVLLESSRKLRVLSCSCLRLGQVTELAQDNGQRSVRLSPNSKVRSLSPHDDGRRAPNGPSKTRSRLKSLADSETRVE